MPLEDLAAYRQRVARVLTGASDELVFNGSISHARVVFEEAFKAASSEIRIVTSKLSRILDSGDVIDAALSFARRPLSKTILLVEEFPLAGDLRKSSFIANVHAVAGDRLTVRKIPADLAHAYPFNFMTVDQAAYRFEDDRSVPVAVVAGGWGATATVAHLNVEFAKLLAASVPAYASAEAAA